MPSVDLEMCCHDRFANFTKLIELKTISIDETVVYLGIKTVTLRNWIKNKPDILVHRIGKLWKFKRSELDEWIASGKSAE